MALFGKLGDQVITRENITNLSSMHNPQNGYYGQSPNNNMNQNFNNNANNANNTKFDFTRCIKIRYHNPASIDINSNSSNLRDNFIQQLNNIRCPDLSNLQKIIGSCDSMKPEITSYMALDTKLDDILAKNKVETNVNVSSSNNFQGSHHLPPKNQNQNQNFNQNQNQGQTYTSTYPTGSAWSGSTNMNVNVNNQGNSNVYQSVFPQQQFPQQAKGYGEYDIARFERKFKCAREMAIGYLEAFQNYDEAEQQFIQNTGWKG